MLVHLHLSTYNVRTCILIPTQIHLSICVLSIQIRIGRRIIIIISVCGGRGGGYSVDVVAVVGVGVSRLTATTFGGGDHKLR